MEIFGERERLPGVEALLSETLERFRMRLLACCLMPNIANAHRRDGGATPGYLDRFQPAPAPWGGVGRVICGWISSCRRQEGP